MPRLQKRGRYGVCAPLCDCLRCLEHHSIKVCRRELACQRTKDGAHLLNETMGPWVIHRPAGQLRVVSDEVHLFEGISTGLELWIDRVEQR